MCSGFEAGSYLRLIDSCITQLKAQGPSRTYNESTEGKNPKPYTPNQTLDENEGAWGEKEEGEMPYDWKGEEVLFFIRSSLLLSSLELSDAQVYEPQIRARL